MKRTHCATRICCRLKEIMKERGMSVSELSQLSGVDRSAITALRNNTWKLLSKDTAARICAALEITMEELLVVVAEDIWFPIKLTREVTIHLGATSDRLALHGRKGAMRKAVFDRQVVGLWDVRSANFVSEYLNKNVPGIVMRREEHVAGVGAGVLDPAGGNQVERVFREGNHIIIGSSLINQFAEETVCRAFDATPFTPGNGRLFPFNFVWDFPVSTASSFGVTEVGAEAGIVHSPTGKLVARRTFVAHGAGEDAALIVTLRIWQPPARRRLGLDDERIIVWILGLSGPGTYGGVTVATNPRNATLLFPERRGQAHMAVAVTQYVRPATDGSCDNRDVRWAELLEEIPTEPNPKAA